MGNKNITANIEYKHIIQRCVDTFFIGFIGLMLHNKMFIGFTNLFVWIVLKRMIKKYLNILNKLKLELVCTSKARPYSSSFCVWGWLVQRTKYSSPQVKTSWIMSLINNT